MLATHNEIPQAANRVVGGVGHGVRAADCVVGAELLAFGLAHVQLSGTYGIGTASSNGMCRCRHIRFANAVDVQNQFG